MSTHASHSNLQGPTSTPPSVSVSVSANADGSIPPTFSSNPRGSANQFFIEHPQFLASLAAPNSPPPPQEHRPPPALEEANVNNELHFPPLGSQSESVAYSPTPRTPMNSLGNLDTFIHALQQELHHIPNPPIKCSVKQNDEPENVCDGPLEQRIEKKMNVQLSSTLPAANQRVKLPVPPLTVACSVFELKPLFLSLVIAGETTRHIFGGVGLYHLNQPNSELVEITVGSNFVPVVGITSGRTVCIGFKFTTYPRRCDPSEKAFRAVATIHDCDGRLVTYSLSAFAYSIKSHPRDSQRALQASARSRNRRRSTLNTTPSTSITTNHPLRSSPFAAGSSGPPQFSVSANTGGPPAPFVHGPYGLLPFSPPEGYQAIPILVEVVPPSCTWLGGMVVSLFVKNLPQDGPIYVSFGGPIVGTYRKTPDVLICRVPPALFPCEVDVTLFKGNGPFDLPYGVSPCKFTYEDDVTIALPPPWTVEFQTSPDRALLHHNPIAMGIQSPKSWQVKLHEQGNQVSECQIPYSFKSAVKPDRDRSLWDHPKDSLHLVQPPVVSPVATTMPVVARRIVSHTMNSIISTAKAPCQRPAPPEDHHPPFHKDSLFGLTISAPIVVGSNPP